LARLSSRNSACVAKARIVVRPSRVSEKCEKTGDRKLDSMRFSWREEGM